MADRRVRCPQCAVILRVPGGFTGTKVLCTACSSRFYIPALSDAVILDWIGVPNKDDSWSDQPVDTSLTESPTAAVPGPQDVVEQASTSNLPLTAAGLLLVRIDRRGALFEFPAELLQDKHFRGAMPRRCIRCGTKSHIQPHVVIFGHAMADCSSLENEFLERRPDISDNDARNLPTEQLLDRLPGVMKVPAPVAVPMPFWVCDMCSPSNMVFAQSEVHHDHGERVLCHLQVRRLWRAEEFAVAAGAAGSAGFDSLHRAVEESQEKPWDTLAGVVQQRLQQWYHPHKGERFVAYIPDRTRARTEDGMVGLVVSNRRLIYHHQMRHRESEKGEPLELQFAMDAGKGNLHIKSPNWEIRNISVDKPGLEWLRRSLTAERFHAAWH